MVDSLGNVTYLLDMNRNQKAALFAGLLAFLVNFVLPPRGDSWGPGPLITEGYGPIHGAALCVQWFVIAVVTAGAIALLSGAPEAKP